LSSAQQGQPRWRAVAGLVLAGGIVVAISLSINRNAGPAIVAGLLSPDSPEAIAISVAKLLVPAVGPWLIYRGLS
jgi:hypothetical protein